MFRLIIPVGTSRASWAVSRRTFNWSCWWLILSSSLMISRLTFSTSWFESFVFSIKLESTHFTASVPFSKMKRSCHKYILRLQLSISGEHDWAIVSHSLAVHLKKKLITIAPRSSYLCIVFASYCWQIAGVSCLLLFLPKFPSWKFQIALAIVLSRP